MDATGLTISLIVINLAILLVYLIIPKYSFLSICYAYLLRAQLITDELLFGSFSFKITARDSFR